MSCPYNNYRVLDPSKQPGLDPDRLFQSVYIVNPDGYLMGTNSSPIIVSGIVSTNINPFTNAMPILIVSSGSIASAPRGYIINSQPVTIAAANPNRKSLYITNISSKTQAIYLAFGQDAVIGSGLALYNPGTTWEMDSYTFSTASISAISSTKGGAIALQEFSNHS